MKKPAKIEELNQNLSRAKSERTVPLKSTTRKISVKEIECNPARQPREEIDKSYVSDLKDVLTSGGSLPAIIVFSANGNAPYFIADGWHRLKAHENLKQIEAEVREGNAQSAFYFSLQANTSHGKRLTNADKRRKVTLALNDEIMATWSDRRISDWCGTSHILVADVRASTGNTSSSTTDSAPNKPKAERAKRVGKDGKARSTKKPITDKPPKKEDLNETLDDLGQVLPSDIVPDWNRSRETCKDWLGQLSAMRTAIKSDDLIYSEVKGVIETIDVAYTQVKNIGGSVKCPVCDAKPTLRSKCKTCNKRGYVSKFFYNQNGKKK